MAISGMCLLFLLVTSGISVVNNTDDDSQQYPISFIMDKFHYQMSFFQHQRVLIDLVKGLPGEVYFKLITVNGSKTETFVFKKREINETWMEKIGLESSSIGNINYTTVTDALCIDEQNMANIVFFLINEKTKIIDVEKIKKVLKNQKIQIVCYGNDTSAVWKELSTAEKTLINLGDHTDDVHDVVNFLQSRYSVDSKLVCDTDEYWNKDKKACYPCSKICSDRSFCSECPCYISLQKTQVMENNLDDSSKADDTDLSTLSRQIKTNKNINISILTSIGILILVVLCCMKKKNHRQMSCLKMCERFQTHSIKGQNGREERVYYKNVHPDTSRSNEDEAQRPLLDDGQPEDDERNTKSIHSPGMGTEGSSPDCAETPDKTPSTVESEEGNLEGVDLRDLDSEESTMVDVREPETAEQPYIAQPSDS